MAGPKSTQTRVVGIITDEMHPYEKCVGMHLICYYPYYSFVSFLALPSLLISSIYLVAFYTCNNKVSAHLSSKGWADWTARWKERLIWVDFGWRIHCWLIMMVVCRGHWWHLSCTLRVYVHVRANDSVNAHNAPNHLQWAQYNACSNIIMVWPICLKPYIFT